jgi:hypothetical protein
MSRPLKMEEVVERTLEYTKEGDRINYTTNQCQPGEPDRQVVSDKKMRGD